MGSSLSCEEIYTAYKKKVLCYIRGKVSNPYDVEDLVSCVFLKIYRNLDSFDEAKASLSTWIYRVTQNTVTDWYRTNRVNEEVPETLPADIDIEDALLEEDTLEELANALEKLDSRERDLIILHYYSGHTLKKIAEMMNLSYAMIKIVHKSALNSLRQQLSDKV